MAEGGIGYKRQFHPRKLYPCGRSLPPSIPLLAYDNYELDPETYTLKRKNEGDPRKLHLTDVALDLLKNIKKPLAVLAIWGPVRTGKSYFLSRILSHTLGNSNSGVFPLGHTMRTCTRGIWMATTALECDEFVLLLLDTEGTGAAEAMEATPTNILIMSILLSSYLIYNSKGVPTKSDLNSMSCFAHLSSCILAESDDKQDNLFNLRRHFPDFLWMLRDAMLKATDENGMEISYTQYLNDHILVPSNATTPTANDHVARAICELFPSRECKALVPPSSDPDMLTSILQRQGELQGRFNREVDETVEHILQNIKPKCGFTGEPLNGAMLASLAERYRDALNTPNAVPNLETSWLTVIELKLQNHITRMITEYNHEMEDAMKGKLPLEIGSRGDEEQPPQTLMTLMQIHNSIAKPKHTALGNEINRLLIKSSGATTHLHDHFMVEFQCQAAQVLSRFKERNFDSSQAQCEELFAQLYHPIQEKISTPGYSIGEFHCHIKRLRYEYFSQSLGPARHKVWWEKQCKVIGTVQETDFIPGPPLNLQVSGRAHDRIKIHWDHPDINATAVGYCKVEMKSQHEIEKEWTEVARRRTRLSAVVKNLQPDAVYYFRICAINGKETEGVYSTKLKTSTKYGTKGKVYLTSLAGIGAGIATKTLATAAAVALLPSAPVLVPVVAVVAGAMSVGGVLRVLSDDNALNDSDSDAEPPEAETLQPVSSKPAEKPKQPLPETKMAEIGEEGKPVAVPHVSQVHQMESSIKPPETETLQPVSSKPAEKPKQPLPETEMAKIGEEEEEGKPVAVPHVSKAHQMESSIKPPETETLQPASSKPAEKPKQPLPETEMAEIGEEETEEGKPAAVPHVSLAQSSFKPPETETLQQVSSKPAEKPKQPLPETEVAEIGEEEEEGKPVAVPHVSLEAMALQPVSSKPAEKPKQPLPETEMTEIGEEETAEGKSVAVRHVPQAQITSSIELPKTDTLQPVSSRSEPAEKKPEQPLSVSGTEKAEHRQETEKEAHQVESSIKPPKTETLQSWILSMLQPAEKPKQQTEMAEIRKETKEEARQVESSICKPPETESLQSWILSVLQPVQPAEKPKPLVPETEMAEPKEETEESNPVAIPQETTSPCHIS